MAFVARDLTAEFHREGLGDKYGPELVVGVFDEKTGEFRGGIVGDNASLCPSDKKVYNGGIREVSDPKWLEVSPLEHLQLLFKFLARPMTLKHFWCYDALGPVPEFGLWGGGKGTIVRGRFDGSRDELFCEWTKAVSEFSLADGRKLLGEAFIGGADAGINEKDLALICEVNGSNKCVTGGPGSFQYEAEGITGRIMLHAAKIFVEEYNSRAPHNLLGFDWDDNLRLGIYGAGNVGKGVLMWLSDKDYFGPRVSAVSNKRISKEGGILNFGGIDAGLLFRASGDPEFGISSLVGDETFPYEPGEELYMQHLDVLFLAVPIQPVITIENAGRIEPKIIVCGTNSGITDEAYDILFRNGVITGVHFVENMGAASAAKSSWHGLPDEECVELAKNAIESNLRWLLNESRRTSTPIYKLASKAIYSRLAPLARN